MTTTDTSVYRVLDANVNRLREALRVVEEFVRFVKCEPTLASRLKAMRHDLETFERTLGRSALLSARNTGDDPFASGNTPAELARSGPAGLASANLKRGQEASRVLEEYVKLTGNAECAETAKRIRFELYTLEKDLMDRLDDGSTQRN